MGKCRDCKFNEKVTNEQKEYALKVQSIRAKLITNKDKGIEIMALLGYEEFSKIVGLEDLTYNNLPVEIQGTDIYRVCENEEQLKDAGIKEGCNVHKTYFTCEHWEDEND